MRVVNGRNGLHKIRHPLGGFGGCGLVLEGWKGEVVAQLPGNGALGEFLPGANGPCPAGLAAPAFDAFGGCEIARG